MMTVWIPLIVLYIPVILGMGYQIRHAPTDVELWGEEIE